MQGIVVGKVDTCGTCRRGFAQSPPNSRLSLAQSQELEFRMPEFGSNACLRTICHFKGPYLLSHNEDGSITNRAAGFLLPFSIYKAIGNPLALGSCMYIPTGTQQCVVVQYDHCFPECLSTELVS